MASKSLFQTFVGKFLPSTNTTNAAGAPAYAFTSKHALAQYAATGCFNSTFYASAEAQLSKVLELTKEVEPEFVAKTAVYARERGAMKDMPAFLCAALSVNSPALCGRVFPRVIDDAKMVRNFVQILRSGAVGRKSLGTRPKKLVKAWLESNSDEALFRASVGQSPSLADVVKMVHPTPATESRRALYGYLLGREHKAELLPETVRAFEDFKACQSTVVPNVPFQMLTALELSTAQWVEIARNAPLQMTRMNLNTFARHGVFNTEGMAALIATRLRDVEALTKARVLPYQLLAAYRNASSDVPHVVKEALQDAMEIATRNVPKVDGKVYILVDVSGSMGSPITGHRAGATSTIRCIDVAALVAAAILRKNPAAEVIPFEQHVVTRLTINERDSVMTNAEKLASIGGGGTKCSAPLIHLNEKFAKGDLVIFISDNESWLDARQARATAVLYQWNAFKERNPQAKLVCIDVVPNATTQVPEQADVLNIGGFSDAVFDMLAAFARGQMSAGHWTSEIDKVVL